MKVPIPKSSLHSTEKPEQMFWPMSTCVFLYWFFFLHKKWIPNQLRESESEVAQLYLTLCSPMDCSLPRSSVHGIFQARVLEWVAISFFRGSSWPRDRTQISRIVSRHFTVWATREVLPSQLGDQKVKKQKANENITDSFCYYYC